MGGRQDTAGKLQVQAALNLVEIVHSVRRVLTSVRCCLATPVSALDVAVQGFYALTVDMKGHGEGRAPAKPY